MKFIRVILIIVCAALLMVIGYMLLMKIAFLSWPSSIVEEGNEIMETALGDDFYVEFKTSNFPDYETIVQIREDTDKKAVITYSIEEGYKQPIIKVLIGTIDITCYMVNDNHLLFKVKDGEYESIGLREIDNIKPDDYPNFIDVAKTLFDTREWRWVLTCSGFLLKSNKKDDVLGVLERYADGRFTQEELDINSKSDITQEYVMMFAKIEAN